VVQLPEREKIFLPLLQKSPDGLKLTMHLHPVSRMGLKKATPLPLHMP
jgi:hypothetical protein